MTLHAAWKIDREGAAAARQDIALIKFFGAACCTTSSTARCRRTARWATRPTCRWSRCTASRAPRGFYDGPDEVHRQSVARQILRGYEAPADGVPSEHVPYAPRRGARAVRRPARGRHLQRLRRVLSRLSLPRRRSPRACRDAARTARREHRERGRASTASTGRAPSRSCAERSSSARARRARRRCAGWRCGCAPGCRAGASSGPRPSGPAQRRRPHPGQQAGDPRRRALRHQGPAGLRRRQRRRGRHGRGGRAGARAAPRPSAPSGAPELRFVLFDGEEATDDDARLPATGLRGSNAYARRHADELRALVAARLRGRQGPAASRARRARTRAVVAAARAPRAASARRRVPRRDAGRDPRRPHAVPARGSPRST